MANDKAQEFVKVCDSKIFSLTKNAQSENTSGGYQPTQNQTITLLKMDFPDILRAHAETLMEFYERGRNSVISTSNAIQQTPKGKFASIIYIGIYDNVSYGVYDDQEKLLKSRNYWQASRVKQQEFETYDAALRFARNGVSQVNGVPENAIPPMQFAINWRQKI